MRALYVGWLRFVCLDARPMKIYKPIQTREFLVRCVLKRLLGFTCPNITAVKRVELSPRGASCEPNHRFYGPVMEGWEAALESCTWL